MQFETRTEEYNPTIDVGERDVDYEAHLETPEVESTEDSKNFDAKTDSIEGLDKVTDEEIKSGAIFEKVEALTAKDRGGIGEEIKVNRDYDSRNLGYMNAEGFRINKETGGRVADELRELYKGKKSEEEIEKLVAKAIEIDKLLFDNPNTLIPTNDYEVTKDGVKGLQVGYAIRDSEGRISYPGVDMIPAEETPEEDEDDEIPSEFETNNTNADSVQFENADLIVEEDSQISEPETVAVLVEETEEVVVETSEEDLAKTLAQLFTEPQSQQTPENIAKPSYSIIDQLAEQFGFTYGPDKTENVQSTESLKNIAETIPGIVSNESSKDESVKEVISTPKIERNVVASIEVSETLRALEIVEVQPIKLIFKDEPKEIEEAVALEQVKTEARPEILLIKVPKFEKLISQEEFLVSVPEKEVDLQKSEEIKIIQEIVTEYKQQVKEIVVNSAEPVESIATPTKAETFVVEVVQITQVAEVKKTEEPAAVEIVIKEETQVMEKNVLQIQERIDIKNISVQEASITNDFVKRIERRAFITDETIRAVRDEVLVANQTHERVGSGRIGTSVTDDTEAVNDNEPELATSNGITMRRAA